MRSKSKSSRAESTVAVGKRGRVDPAYEPSRTKLGAALRRIRRRIIESGTPLLNAKQIRREVAERRGGAR